MKSIITNVAAIRFLANTYIKGGEPIHTGTPYRRVEGAPITILLEKELIAVGEKTVIRSMGFRGPSRKCQVPAYLVTDKGKAYLALLEQVEMPKPKTAVPLVEPFYTTAGELINPLP